MFIRIYDLDGDKLVLVAAVFANQICYGLTVEQQLIVSSFVYALADNVTLLEVTKDALRIEAIKNEKESQNSGTRESANSKDKKQANKQQAVDDKDE